MVAMMLIAVDATMWRRRYDLEMKETTTVNVDDGEETAAIDCGEGYNDNVGIDGDVGSAALAFITSLLAGLRATAGY